MRHVASVRQLEQQPAWSYWSSALASMTSGLEDARPAWLRVTINDLASTHTSPTVGCPESSRSNQRAEDAARSLAWLACAGVHHVARATPLHNPRPSTLTDGAPTRVQALCPPPSSSIPPLAASITPSPSNHGTAVTKLRAAVQIAVSTSREARARALHEPRLS